MSASDDYTDLLQQADADRHPIGSSWTFLGVIAVLVISVSSLAHLF